MDDASSGSALPERSTEKTYGYCWVLPQATEEESRTKDTSKADWIPL